jgi:BirA family biotin operon repressor/biotin-[acetyl-CoA-carboxylase] ligase
MKEQVLALLTESGQEYLSGEDMSERLSVSRAAVWKAIEALREDGYEIEAAPRRGYRLVSGPDRLTQGSILPHLETDAQRQRLICLETVDSTNNYAKTIAMDGAPSGTAIVADEQTGGRGRLGRSFQSPKGKGIYVTLLYRPHIAPIQAVNLTAYVAVAICDGIEDATGVRPKIKWTNDIVLGGKKLCGILTEMAVEGESGTLQYIITGIGINANHTPADFSPEVEPIATSLYQQLGTPVPRGKLCACIINALDRMYAQWSTSQDGGYWQRYRDDCLTLGKPVRLIRGDQTQEAFAEDIDRDFGLIVRHPDGRRETVNSGEVSVRGLWGYMD